MFGISSVNSGYTTVSAKAEGMSGPKSKPIFGSATASFHTQPPQVRPMTPKMEKNHAIGHRLDYFA